MANPCVWSIETDHAPWHLIGGHQRPGRHHAIAAERIAHDEVAPIRKGRSEAIAAKPAPALRASAGFESAEAQSAKAEAISGE
jgi:hypothetical protein